MNIIKVLYYDRIDISERLMLIMQGNQKSVISVTIDIF